MFGVCKYLILGQRPINNIMKTWHVVGQLRSLFGDIGAGVGFFCPLGRYVWIAIGLKFFKKGSCLKKLNHANIVGSYLVLMRFTERNFAHISVLPIIN